jgi:hypothetical protein
MYINELTTTENIQSMDSNVHGGASLVNLSVAPSPGSLKTQNVTFCDENPSWMHVVENDIDKTFGVIDNSDAPLGSYLERPVKIQDFTWDPGSAFFQTFDPWTNFFENARVVNRINNFNLVRCNLHLRFLINGSPFHYGRLLVGYKPRYSATPANSPDRMETIAARSANYNCALSQKPHVFLDPTTSAGADMVLPYISPSNYLFIPAGDWRRMGGVIIQSLNTLKHAQGSADTVAISVFAWAESVSLAIPTTEDAVGLTAQGGCLSRALEAVPLIADALYHADEEDWNEDEPCVCETEIFEPQMGFRSWVKDEFGHQFISKPAAAVAHIAGKLSAIPLIGPYARAAETGAGTLAEVSGLLGFSRPTTADQGQLVVPRPGGNWVNTNLPDTSDKLTYDWKQETTHDPRTIGLSGNDDMALRSIAAHESYMGTFTWAQATASETLLWNAYVTPCVAVGSSSGFYLTAPGFVAAPFDFWRGTIRYRFQIEASAYHRGRIKIVYDPHDMGNSSEYQSQYTHIVDLQAERDFTIDVGWGQPYSYLHTDASNVSYYDQTDTAALTITTGQSTYNGVIGVYVVNELSGPDDSINNDVAINVYISMGEDAEFFGPSDDFLHEVSYFAQSGYEAQSGKEKQVVEEGTTEPNKPLQEETEMSLAPHMLADKEAAAIYHGDPVVSFRNILKRYSFHTSYRFSTGSSTNATVNHVALRSWYFPFYRGDAVTDVGSTDDSTNGGTAGYNLAAMTMLNYLTPAFVGIRGGIRWKFAVEANNTIRGYQSIVRREGVDSSRDGFSFAESTSTTTSLAGTAVNDVEDYVDTAPHMGMVHLPIHQNPVIEAEIPYHNIHRFYHARNLLANNIPRDEANLFTYKADFITAADTAAKAKAFCAAGDDFSLFLYQGPPLMKPYTIAEAV